MCFALMFSLAYYVLLTTIYLYLLICSVIHFDVTTALFQVAVLCGSVVSLCSFWGVLMVVGQNGFDVLISSISLFTPGGLFVCLY